MTNISAATSSPGHRFHNCASRARPRLASYTCTENGPACSNKAKPGPMTYNHDQRRNLSLFLDNAFSLTGVWRISLHCVALPVCIAVYSDCIQCPFICLSGMFNRVFCVGPPRIRTQKEKRIRIYQRKMQPHMCATVEILQFYTYYTLDLSNGSSTPIFFFFLLWVNKTRCDKTTIAAPDRRHFQFWSFLGLLCPPPFDCHHHDQKESLPSYHALN
jgi:hypothetical protein